MRMQRCMCNCRASLLVHQATVPLGSSSVLPMIIHQGWFGSLAAGYMELFLWKLGHHSPENKAQGHKERVCVRVIIIEWKGRGFM